MKTLYTLSLCVFGLLVASSSCSDKETPFVLPTPQILLADGGDHVETTQEPGKEVSVDFTLQAASGLSEFHVYQDDEIIAHEQYTRGELSTNYTLAFQVPGDAPLGTTYRFRLTLVDREGRTVDFEASVTADATYELTEETINGTTVKRLSGRINGDFHFSREDTYLIDGTVAIEDGGTLTIDAGSTVYFRTVADAQYVSRLVIARGSRIQASGTRTDPIVLTSDKVLRGETPQPTDWGGLFVYGRAPGNRGATVVEDGYAYGGNAANESSGRLQYLRIEYAGKGENHALHLFGVGSGTVVDHIQVFHCENNAIRLRGGRVSMRYMAGIEHGGYGLWADEGWQGRGQFWLFQTSRPATLVPVNFWNQARSLEFRNHDSFYESTPRTTFQISNVTLIGNGATQDQGTRRGVRIRTGAQGVLRNLVATGFPNDAVRVEDLPIASLGQQMVLDNVRAFNNGINYAQEAESFFLQSDDYDVSEAAVPGITLERYVGSASSPFNPPAMDSWFQSAAYIGAVENEANDWTRGGNWFKNPDGSIRQ